MNSMYQHNIYSGIRNVTQDIQKVPLQPFLQYSHQPLIAVVPKLMNRR